MFSANTTKIVCDFLLSLARTEKKIELLREKLSEIEEFEPYASFRRLDRGCKNFITEDDIKQFLQDNEIFFDEETIKATYVQHYDYDSDGRLCYAEYLRSLLPCDQPGLRTLVTQRPTYQVNQDELLEKNVEVALAKFLEAEILSYLNLDSQKKEISYCGDFSNEVLFSEVDREQSNYVDFQNLNEYFKSNNYYPYEEEIISILRRLDRNDDGRLTTAEFQQAFKPLGPKEFKPKNLKELYSVPGSGSGSGERNQSASKNNNSKHTKNSSISYVNSNSKKNNNSSPYYKSGAIYRSPIVNKKSSEEAASDSYSKITTKIDVASGIKMASSNVTNLNITSEVKPPANYSYYPYEPVRRAFSPLKEQIMKSSAIAESSPKLPKSSNERSLVEKYDKFNSYRAKYGNGSDYKTKSPVIPKNYGRLEESNIVDRSLKREIVNYFKKVVSFEGEIEKNKQDLFFRPDFNLFDLYMVFDREKKGYCFLNDFEAAFKLMNINITGKEAVLFFKKFEKNNCGRLRLADFSKIFAPILLEGQPQTERRSINNEGQFDYYDLFSAETRRLITSVLKLHLEYEVSIESQRDTFSSKEKASVQEVFDIIDSNKDGLIDFYEMKAFLENEGSFTDRDITLLNERMNPVINGKISFEDFRNELRPHL